MRTHRQTEPCQRCQLSHDCLSPRDDEANLSFTNTLVQDSALLKKGEFLFHQEEKFRGLFAVKSGALKTFLVNECSEEKVTAFYLPGEVLGLDAVSEEHYQKNAQALVVSEVCRIPFNELLTHASTNTCLQKALFKLFSYKIKQSIQHFHCNAEQKLASFLLDYSNRLAYQKFDSHNFHLLLTQQDIASYLDLTPETISRIFHKFLAEGFFTSPKSKAIRNLNREALKKILH